LFEGHVHFFSHWFSFRSSTKRKCEKKGRADGLNAASVDKKILIQPSFSSAISASHPNMFLGFCWAWYRLAVRNLVAKLSIWVYGYVKEIYIVSHQSPLYLLTKRKVQKEASGKGLPRMPRKQLSFTKTKSAKRSIGRTA
jgi:hypothetical protein